VSASVLNRPAGLGSGSEDNCIYVYERNSGKMVNRLEGHTSVVHLVDAVDSELKLVSSSIENVRSVLGSLHARTLTALRGDRSCPRSPGH
jgi:hypothetical protein